VKCILTLKSLARSSTLGCALLDLLASGPLKPRFRENRAWLGLWGATEISLLFLACRSWHTCPVFKATALIRGDASSAFVPRKCDPSHSLPDLYAGSPLYFKFSLRFPFMYSLIQGLNYPPSGHVLLCIWLLKFVFPFLNGARTHITQSVLV